MSHATPPELASAQQRFAQMVEEVRPDLHRYASRLVGSAFEGEDVVQDTLAKAFYALSQSPEVPELRPWLFRIARNTAIDLLRRYERKNVASLTDTDIEDPGEERNPEALRAALSAFMRLPPSQRSAVILKDVLGESLEDIAAHLDTTVGAVKSLLVRGRRTLAEAGEGGKAPPPNESSDAHRALVRQYVTLFNERDWDGVRALLVDEVRLDLVSKSQRRGKAVGMYFSNYAAIPDVRLVLGRSEGREVLGVYRGESEELLHVIVLESEGGRVRFIRDYKYVPYLVRELEFVPDE